MEKIKILFCSGTTIIALPEPCPLFIVSMNPIIPAHKNNISDNNIKLIISFTILTLWVEFEKNKTILINIYSKQNGKINPNESAGYPTNKNNKKGKRKTTAESIACKIDTIYLILHVFIKIVGKQVLYVYYIIRRTKSKAFCCVQNAVIRVNSILACRTKKTPLC
ncbi:MAG: hypothetical protein FWH03_05160 [Firmicutes bacterium]|nr:hypothetical protein [Bacillota bacterium]